MVSSWKKTLRFVCQCLPALVLLSACSSQSPIPTAKPGAVKVGKPYTINGITYYPKFEPDYDKVGEASWYGPGFHGKLTANGEIYDQTDLTAAHPTLPLPSMVRVTNLKNGKSAIIRVNDRGPFKRNRIIDLSRNSADAIGMRNLAKVRVQYLHDETEAYLAMRKAGADKDADLDGIRRLVAQKRAQSMQIVERTESNSYVGQSVNDAAPILSVASDDLSSNTSRKFPQPKDNKRPSYMMQANEGRSAVNKVTYNNVEPYIQSTDYTSEPRYVRNELGQPIKNAASTDMAISDNHSVNHDNYGRDPPTLATPAKASPSAGPRQNDEYTIQIGAFSKEENARKLYRTLSHIAAVSIANIKASGQSLWRVRMGPFLNFSDASDALGKVHQTGIPDARILK